MINEQFVLKNLEALIDRLQGPARMLWESAVRQQYIEGIASLLGVLFFIGLLILCQKLLDECFTDEVFLAILFFVYVVGLLVVLIWFFCEFPDIFNARYAAFTELVKLLR